MNNKDITTNIIEPLETSHPDSDSIVNTTAVNTEESTLLSGDEIAPPADPNTHTVARNDGDGPPVDPLIP